MDKKKPKLTVLDFPIDESEQMLEACKERIKEPGYRGTIIIGLYPDDIDLAVSTGAARSLPLIIHALEFVKQKLILEELTGVIYEHKELPIDDDDDPPDNAS